MIITCKDCPTQLTVSPNNRRKRCPACARKAAQRQDTIRKQAHKSGRVSKRVSAATDWQATRERIKAKYGAPGYGANGGRSAVVVHRARKF